MIAENPGITQGALAHMIEVEAPTLSQMLSPLVKSGMIRRGRSAETSSRFRWRSAVLQHQGHGVVRRGLGWSVEDLLDFIFQFIGPTENMGIILVKPSDAQ